MDEKLYPPRFKAVVQAKSRNFFRSSKYLHFQLTCGTEIIKGKLVVPGFGMKVQYTCKLCNLFFFIMLYYRLIWYKLQWIRLLS